MASTSLELSREFASFSGVDIRVIVEGTAIGSIQALSYAVQREKAPIYVMGRVDPLSFSRGKRGIAGTMITLMLDHHILNSAPFNDLQFLADNDEIYANADNIQDAAALRDLEEVIGPVSFDDRDISENFTVMTAWYVDQVPPIDIVIIGANEYGNAATMRIYGAEILNEGSGYSVDDMVIESQMTYVCRAILPWQRLGRWDFASGVFTPTGSGQLAPQGGL